MKEPGTLCVPVAGRILERRRELSAEILVTIQILVNFLIPSYFLFCMIVFPYLESVVANFGHGSNPILPFSIQCGIDDTALSECTTTRINVSECLHIAGVICQGLYMLTWEKIIKKYPPSLQLHVLLQV